MDHLENSVRIDIENKLEESSKVLNELNNILEKMKKEDNQIEIIKIETEIYEQNKVAQRLEYTLLRNNVHEIEEMLEELERERTLSVAALKVMKKKLEQNKVVDTTELEQDITDTVIVLELTNKDLEKMKKDKQKLEALLAEFEKKIIYSGTMTIATRGEIDDKLYLLKEKLKLKSDKSESDKSEITKIESEIYELNEIAKKADEAQQKSVENMLDNMDEETLKKSEDWFNSFMDSCRLTEEANTETETKTESKE
jgi:hypothetical protein